ncbi:MAG: histidinol-phosphatase HisJ family protein [Verrucomicrobia bacterium]|nr:MAG: histidinol-phosphatase HisJ family protein [Verrucomicrobiota bacterium]TAE89256.1 MAG: histidinol-phosphatase HisJ family protein [Verrucomicrobiota bacterium]TAF27870.1 MAG: histidinol-phosphatase HisJ family protein [Verrucomicrobiota bacterium]TAF42719.1 MAG: histidinol-phosphatase HisJ family protein [Verrucomicrobiota bacterium]
MPADYHTHTPLCRHANGTPEEFIAAGKIAGLSEYGISDHAPCLPEPFDDWRMLESELPDYFDWIDRARSAAAGTLAVRSGLECDWLTGCESWIEKLAARYPWDYLIGSVHYLGTWDFDNPKWLGRWAQSDVDAVWALYWKTYAEMAASGLFDVLAHPDLVKKFAHRPTGDLDRFYDPVIAAIAKGGSAIELNTAGWHKPCAEAYPHPRFLQLAAQAGIPLVISSDAHAPDEVGRDFPHAIELAKAAGYSETLRFDRRHRFPESL